MCKHGWSQESKVKNLCKSKQEIMRKEPKIKAVTMEIRRIKLLDRRTEGERTTKDNSMVTTLGLRGRLKLCTRMGNTEAE